jgi:hypothetical protein
MNIFKRPLTAAEIKQKAIELGADLAGLFAENAEERAGENQECDPDNERCHRQKRHAVLDRLAEYIGEQCSLNDQQDARDERGGDGKDKRPPAQAAQGHEPFIPGFFFGHVGLVRHRCLVSVNAALCGAQYRS